MTNPILMLKHEHITILKVVRTMDVLRQIPVSGGRMDIALFREIIRFMRVFADQCHHAKEEDLLFPAMVAMGVPENGCPIGGLTHEHVQGRELVALLENGIELYESDPEQAAINVNDAVTKIVKLYTNHIWKEDDMVFPMVEKMFNEAQLAHLAAAFEQADIHQGSDRQQFEAFADGLEQKLAIPSV